MYVARNRAIKVPFKLHTRQKRVDQKVLLDSGTTECFVNPRAVQRLQLPMKKLLRPRTVKNVDGTINKVGLIDHAVKLIVNYNGAKVKHNFFVADIGEDEFLLEYPFFEATQPDINWHGTWLEGSVSIASIDANKWIPNRQGQHHRSTVPAWVHVTPGWEEGNKIWQKTIGGKITVAQQLAIDALDQKKKIWQEIVPPEYHHYKIWSEE